MARLAFFYERTVLAKVELKSPRQYKSLIINTVLYHKVDNSENEKRDPLSKSRVFSLSTINYPLSINLWFRFNQPFFKIRTSPKHWVNHHIHTF